MIDEQMSNSDRIVTAPAPKFSTDDPSVIITDAVTPWAASGNLSDKKKDAVVDFMKSYTSEEIMKLFAIEGKDIFAVRLDLNDSEQEAGWN